MDMIQKVNHPAAEVYTRGFATPHQTINDSRAFCTVIILAK